jgi:hypothetical protein
MKGKSFNQEAKMKTLKELEEEIRQLAYELYEKSGKIPGREMENWLEAERMVMERHFGSKGQVSEERQIETEASSGAESPGERRKKFSGRSGSGRGRMKKAE